MEQGDDYSQTQIPSVFVEPTQQPSEQTRDRGVSRGRFAVVSLILFGALVASTAGLMAIRSGEQAEWSRMRQKLETERGAAVDKASHLEASSAQLANELEQAKAKVEKYGSIEYQLNLIREKTQQIQDLRQAKPSYPTALYMNVGAVPEWGLPGERLLKDFVAKLDAERTKLIAFKEPKPPLAGPVTPAITAAPKSSTREKD